MKKKAITLALSLTLSTGLVAGSLAACGGGDEGTWAVPEGPTHWIAGTLAGYEGSGWDPVGEDKKAPIDAVRFEEKGGNYRLIINLYKDDKFKIRYEGTDWDDSAGTLSKLSFEQFDEALREKEDADFVDGGGVGGKDILVAHDGNYEITINKGGDAPVVTYVRKGDAPKLQIAATAVSINKSSVGLEVGGTATLTATLTPANATSEVTWKTGDTAIATVDETGKVTAVAKGTTTVTATAGTVSKSINVIVVGVGEAIPVDSVELDKTTAEIHVGDKLKLTPTISPDSAFDKALSWSALDDGATAGTAATVVSAAPGEDTDAGKGVVTALKPGKAKVTATSGNNKTAECDVTVLKDYALVGSSLNSKLPNWSDEAMKWSDVDESLQFSQRTVGSVTAWEATVSLYVYDQIKFTVVGAGWDGSEIGAESLAESTTTVNKNDEVGGTSNINIKKDGKYKIVIKETTTTEGEETTVTKTIEFERVGDAADLGLPTAEAIVVNIYGAIGSDSKWSGEGFLHATFPDSDSNYTLTGDLTLAAGDKFKLCYKVDSAGEKWVGAEALPNGLPEGLKDSGDIEVDTDGDGVYTVTVSFQANGRLTGFSIVKKP